MPIPHQPHFIDNDGLKENNINEIFQKDSGWIAEVQGKNYVKKKSGIGGGHIATSDKKTKKHL